MKESQATGEWLPGSASPAPSQKNGKEMPSNTSIDEEKGFAESAAADEIPERHNDPNIVDWSGPDDPDMGLNWTRKKKWIMTSLFSSLTLLTYVKKSMILSRRSNTQ